MGISLMKGCFTNTQFTSPNPSPGRFKVLSTLNYKNSTVLVVRYLGCTNFEGVKVLVFQGTFTPGDYLDPHFSNTDVSPIARFKPTAEGIALAMRFALSL